MLHRRRLLAVKTEATAGTAESLADADAAMNVFDLVINPTIQSGGRDGQAGFSPLASVTGARSGQATFRTQLVGGATIPKWASVLLPACGFTETSRVFTPKSAPPGTSNVKTITLAGYVDGTLKMLRGAMGTAVLNFISGDVVDISWTFTGIWVDVTDAAPLTPTFPLSEAPLRFASSSLAIGSWNPKVGMLSLDLGNTVILAQDSRDVSGYCHAVVTSRVVKGRLDPESTLVATHDLYGKFLSNAEQALSMTLGSGDNEVAFAAPKLQFLNPQEADRDKLQIDNLEFQCNRSSSGGDDDLSITFGEA